MDPDSEIAPDAKDWTWVLERPCAECGYDAGTVAVTDLGARVRETADQWVTRTDGLPAEAVTRRTEPNTWSVLEYSCHVRDVHRIFDERLALMLAHDEPVFPNWDQDATAVEQRYGEQDPSAVRAELVAAAEQVATTYDAVPETAWHRRGLRDNGSAFTVASLGRYHLHDLVHHLHDIEVLTRAHSSGGTR